MKKIALPFIVCLCFCIQCKTSGTHTASTTTNAASSDTVAAAPGINAMILYLDSMHYARPDTGAFNRTIETLAVPVTNETGTALALKECTNPLTAESRLSENYIVLPQYGIIYYTDPETDNPDFRNWPAQEKEAFYHLNNYLFHHAPESFGFFRAHPDLPHLTTLVITYGCNADSPAMQLAVSQAGKKTDIPIALFLCNGNINTKLLQAITTQKAVNCLSVFFDRLEHDKLNALKANLRLQYQLTDEQISRQLAPLLDAGIQFHEDKKVMGYLESDKTIAAILKENKYYNYRHLQSLMH